MSFFCGPLVSGDGAKKIIVREDGLISVNGQYIFFKTKLQKIKVLYHTNIYISRHFIAMCEITLK